MRLQSPLLRLQQSQLLLPPSSSFPGLSCGASYRGCVLLLLPASQHLLAGIAELVLLLVQACDDAAAAGQRTGAIFVIIRLAGAALVGGLRNR